MTLTSGAFLKQKPNKQTSHEVQKNLGSSWIHKHFNKIELEPVIIRKVATCQRITLKNTQTKWAAT